MRPARTSSVPASVRRAALLAALGGSLLLLALGARSAAAGTLDQQQTVYGDAFAGIWGPDSSTFPLSQAQTFTAGMSGPLDQVDLVVQRRFGTNPLTVEIRGVGTFGLPTGSVLASTSVPASSLPDGLRFVPFVFPSSSQASIVAGTQYAIVAYVGGEDQHAWWGVQDDQYAGGSWFSTSNSPPVVSPEVSWTPHPNQDLAFKTYVVPNQQPSCAGVTASPELIQPAARDQFTTVTLFGATDPDGDTLRYQINGVSQDEPLTGSGDDTSPDARLTAAGAESNQVELRSERNPHRNGRVYRIAYTVSDADGGSCSRTGGVGGDTNAKVSVPRTKGEAAIDDGNTNSWNSISGVQVLGTLP
jgi:hypothetical protein